MHSLIISKQLSDFNITKMIFSPFDNNALVSCGRENIRFWRIKKNHLPGRPVQLNEFSRNHLFSCVSYGIAPPLQSYVGNSDVPKPMPSSGAVVSVFVGSSKGTLLRIDCKTETIICSYQLHASAICALQINHLYAVTGGEDCVLRIWPLDFTDFLMEARHDSAVTNLCASSDLKLLTVGTVSGTIGVLDVFDHRYCTVLRSHSRGGVLDVSCRNPLGDEFMTLGADNTIRMWDTLSGQQKFEFDSPQDSPLCGEYHPNAHIVACGFQSGMLRIFDVQTTSTLYERSLSMSSVPHKNTSNSPILCIRYAYCSVQSSTLNETDELVYSPLRLYALTRDMRLVVYDAENDYSPLKAIQVPVEMDKTLNSKVFLSISKNNKFVAVANGSGLQSLCIYESDDMTIVHKGNILNVQPSAIVVGAAVTSSTFASTLKSNMSENTINHSLASKTSANQIVPINSLVFYENITEENINFPNDYRSDSVLMIVTDKYVINATINDTVYTSTSKTISSVLFLKEEMSIKRLTNVQGQPERDSVLAFPSHLLLSANVDGMSDASHNIHGTGDSLIAKDLFVLTTSLSPNANSNNPSGDSVKATTEGGGTRKVNSFNLMHMVTKSIKAKKSHVCSNTVLIHSQLYTDLPGNKNITSVLFCGATNRVIMCDSSGCISVWAIRTERISRFKNKNMTSYREAISSTSTPDIVKGSRHNAGDNLVDGDGDGDDEREDIVKYLIGAGKDERDMLVSAPNKVIGNERISALEAEFRGQSGEAELQNNASDLNIDELNNELKTSLDFSMSNHSVPSPKIAVRKSPKYNTSMERDGNMDSSFSSRVASNYDNSIVQATEILSKSYIG